MKNILKRLVRIYELNKYDDFTIAELFRKQGARIGVNNKIALRSIGTEPYLITIGDHCSISPGVTLLTHDGSSWVFTQEMPAMQKFGKIEIKDNCYIGVNSIILPNVTIGPNAVVGAGAVVTRDVPPNTVVAGVPARHIRNIDSYREKLLKIWEEQKPAGYMAGLENDHAYAPAYIHENKLKPENKTKLKKHLMDLFLGPNGLKASAGSRREGYARFKKRQGQRSPSS